MTTPSGPFVIASTSASSSAHELSLEMIESPRAASPTLIPMLMMIVAILSTATASSHDDPRMIPDGSDPIVRWYQPPGSPIVTDWDVEIRSFEPGAERSIFPAEAVPDESCWALYIDTEEPVRVRVRAFQDGLVSAWSDSTIVPEPGVAAALGIATPALMIAARRRLRSRTVCRRSDRPDSSGPVPRTASAA